MLYFDVGDQRKKKVGWLVRFILWCLASVCYAMCACMLACAIPFLLGCLLPKKLQYSERLSGLVDWWFGYIDFWVETADRIEYTNPSDTEE